MNKVDDLLEEIKKTLPTDSEVNEAEETNQNQSSNKELIFKHNH